MAGERRVAILAGIVEAATFHLDGDDVGRPAIVLATGLYIEIYAMHVRESGNHRCPSVNVDLADRQQFFVESADFPRSVHEVNLQYPMPLAASSIWYPHPVGILGVYIKSDLIV